MASRIVRDALARSLVRDAVRRTPCEDGRTGRDDRANPQAAERCPGDCDPGRLRIRNARVVGATDLFRRGHLWLGVALDGTDRLAERVGVGRPDREPVSGRRDPGRDLDGVPVHATVRADLSRGMDAGHGRS